MIIKCVSDLRYMETFPNYTPSEIEFDDSIDSDGDLSISIAEDGETNTVYINKKNACEVINHLIEAFELQPSDIGV